MSEITPYVIIICIYGMVIKANVHQICSFAISFDVPVCHNIMQQLDDSNTSFNVDYLASIS